VKVNAPAFSIIILHPLMDPNILQSILFSDSHKRKNNNIKIIERKKKN
jgi:hypothetical protein